MEVKREAIIQGVNMKYMIRYANWNDLENCLMFEHHPDEALLLTKIELEQLIILEIDGEAAGYVKIDYIWGSLPFISLIKVREGIRGKGYGTQLLKFLENTLKEKGFSVLLSSSQVNEAGPQEWHRKQGFQECGILTGINGEGIGELFFKKALF
ncbi:GNAT family N-acetyltransferase [Peribacillus deserti]|uniref:N-acetyltransferase n=1 Tax=Peribacillus deserti TaxID=673318 RepID=A0A2N5M8I2_9BACI|nr:GNAT family N-acetyltransferase [Peribacillus deserti]PLT30669.1 N-acetyltransferase [Peribacillus deserti]